MGQNLKRTRTYGSESATGQPTVWYGLVWLGLVWFDVLAKTPGLYLVPELRYPWFGLVWYGLVWYGMVSD